MMERASLDELSSVLIEHTKTISSLDFSKKIYHLYPELRIIMPTEKVVDYYQSLRNSITDFSEHVGFLEQGLSFMLSESNNGSDYSNVAAFALYRLREISGQIDMEPPSWVPLIYKTDSINSRHQFTYLFDWSTVDPAYIPEHTRDSFITVATGGTISPRPKKHHGSLAEDPLKSMLSLREIADRKSQAKPEKSSKPVKPLAQSGLAPDVAESIYIAKKYLALFNSAESRNLEFNLHLDDVRKLLSHNHCHFSGIELVHFPHDPKEMEARGETLPDNYLTIDRLDSDVGYVRSNVVAAALSINKMKDRLPKDTFTQTLNLYKVLSPNGMTVSQEQIELLSLLSSSKESRQS